MTTEEIARELAGEIQEAWGDLLQSTRDFWIRIAKRSSKMIIEARIEEQENHATHFSIKDFKRSYGSNAVVWAEIVNEKRCRRIAELKEQLKEGEVDGHNKTEHKNV